MERWLLLAAAPLFLACIAAEAWYWRRRGRAAYDLRDTLSNASLALLHQGADALAWLAVLGIYHALYRYRLFDIEVGWATIALLVVLQDFLYYWFHRAHHRIRWMWASHVTHHSSQRLNLSTAFRQSLTYPLSGMWLFWLPLALLGFEPTLIVAVVAINLGVQFFVHTEAVGRLGVLEWVLNTPSHHRVHHARNPRYLDRNYGGLLIVWDRLFGTFAAEDPAEPCEYGIVRQVHGHNPLWLTFHEWIAMARDAARPQPWRSRLRQLFAPPGAAAPVAGAPPPRAATGDCSGPA